MNPKEVIFTGSNGLLGTQMKELIPDIVYTDENDFNINEYEKMRAFVASGSYSMIVHAAAFTSPPLIDNDPVKAVEVNIVGTANVVRLCHEYKLKLVYICTDYIFNGEGGGYTEKDPVFPTNKYAWSKLGGECAVRLYDNHVKIRTTFGPNSFPYPKAFIDQWTSRERVRTIAEKIAFLAFSSAIGTFHVGGSRKTVYEYAKSLDPNKQIETMSIKDISFTVPRDTSMNCSKFNSLWKSGASSFKKGTLKKNDT